MDAYMQIKFSPSVRIYNKCGKSSLCLIKELFFINLAGQLLSHCATTLHHQCTGIPQTGKDSSIIIICCQNAAKSRIRSTSTWYSEKTANKSGKIQNLIDELYHREIWLHTWSRSWPMRLCTYPTFGGRTSTGISISHSIRIQHVYHQT